MRAVIVVNEDNNAELESIELVCRKNCVSLDFAREKPIHSRYAI